MLRVLFQKPMASFPKLSPFVNSRLVSFVRPIALPVTRRLPLVRNSQPRMTCIPASSTAPRPVPSEGRRALISATDLAAFISSAPARYVPSTDHATSSAAPNRVVLLDCSWHMPSTGRDANAEFQSVRIPGARRFDIDAPGLCDAASTLPHMLPSPRDFAAALRELYIPDENAPVTFIAYSTNGLVGAARAWWMMRVFGRDDCLVLDGGLKAWLDGGFPVEAGPIRKETEGRGAVVRNVTEETFRRELVLDMQDVVRNQSAERPVTVVDVRSPGRFAGTSPEPRPGIPSGHIPGSRNLPFTALQEESTGRLKTKAQLRAVMQDHGILLEQSNAFAVTCGTGVTAPIAGLAFYELGVDHVPTYDGSWVEYASCSPRNPIEPRPSTGS